METVYFEAPFSILEIRGNKTGIYEISFVDKFIKTECKSANLKLCLDELQAYFSGNLKNFHTKLCLMGSEFEQDVYRALLQIPYAKTVTYKDIAIKVGRDKACRAVGNANGKNRLPIIVPCHRVVGVNGLGGYSGGDGTNGLEIKKFLLNLERESQ